MEVIKMLNLSVRFLLELCILVIVGYWGFHIQGSGLIKTHAGNRQCPDLCSGMGNFSCAKILHAFAGSLGVVVGSINFWIDNMGIVQHRQTFSCHGFRNDLSAQQNPYAYMETIMNKRNRLALSGLVYVVVWVIGLLIPAGTPSVSTSNAEIQQILLANQLARMVQVYLIDGIAGISILLFAASAANLFRKLDGKNEPLASVVLGAGIAAGSISLVQAGVQQTLTNQELLAAADTPFRMLLVLVNQIDTFKLMALALLSSATSELILRTRIFHVWYGWLGYVLSATLVLGGFSFALSNRALTYILFASLPLLLFWVGAVSLAAMKHTK